MQGDFSMSVNSRTVCRCFLTSAMLFGFIGLTRADDATTPKASKASDQAAPLAKDKDDAAAKTDDSGADDAKKDAAPAAKPKPRKLKQLTQEMTERRDRVRRLLAALRQQPFNTQQNDCSDILEFCRGFGCNTELTDNASSGQAGSGQKVNGITCLCWNMPCAGYEMMTYSDGHLAARIGYGYQSQPSELAAVLALSEVAPDYPARFGRVVRTVADLIEYEKLTCRPGTDMSMKLVALSHYVREPAWKDNLGNEWTLQRMVREELNRPTGNTPHAATNRLMGLVAAVNRFKADKKPIEGDLARAETYIDEATRYAFTSQNSDGSWGRAVNRDYPTAVSYTSHMLEWLVLATPANSLEDPRIAGAVDFLTTSFNAPHYQNYISTMSAREISAAMHTAYVLNFYDQAIFAPADLPADAAPAKPETPAQKAAQVETQPR
jgi:hypothetical protein